MKLKDIIFDYWIAPWGPVTEGLNDRIGNIDIIYIEQGDFYSVKVDDSQGNRLGKLNLDDANKLLGSLNISDQLPQSIDMENTSVLDNIVKQLQSKDINASWSDAMDIS
jgi:hypothetical protein